MTKTALILGSSGNFGQNAAKAFEAAGWTIRRYNRKTGNMTRDAQGADVIVNAMNPPAYHNWKKLIPEITEQVIAAARASGATVIIPGNVYVYGDQPGPWSEETPHRPVARKGRIRTDMEARYRAAAKDGLQVIVLHGGDFIDPDSPGAVLNMVTLKNLAKGRITAMGTPTVPRAYAYLPDMARAAVALAEKRESLAAYEDVNFPGHTFSVTDLKAVLEVQMGHSLKMGRFPWGMIRLASPVWELARELTEMRYLYDTPHRLDGTKFHRLVPNFAETSFETVIARHIPPCARAASRQGQINPDKAPA